MLKYKSIDGKMTPISSTSEASGQVDVQPKPKITKLAPEDLMKKAIEKSNVSRHDFHLEDKQSQGTRMLVSQEKRAEDYCRVDSSIMNSINGQDICQSQQIIVSDIAFAQKMPIVFENENGQILSETGDRTDDEKMMGIGSGVISDQLEASQDLPNDIRPMIKFDSTMNA